MKKSSFDFLGDFLITNLYIHCARYIPRASQESSTGNLVEFLFAYSSILGDIRLWVGPNPESITFVYSRILGDTTLRLSRLVRYLCTRRFSKGTTRIFGPVCEAYCVERRFPRESSLLTTCWSKSTLLSWWLGGLASRHGRLNFLFK